MVLYAHRARLRWVAFRGVAAFRPARAAPPRSVLFVARSVGRPFRGEFLFLERRALSPESETIVNTGNNKLWRG